MPVNDIAKLLNLYVDLVTRLETVDNTPCKPCDGLGWFLNGKPVGPETYPGPFKDGVKPKVCAECMGAGFPGRSVVFWDKEKQIQLSLQDDERTLKIFISNRSKNDNTGTK